nr:MFS transporter [uncultured Pseudodesulfovibrio sp.]
MSTADIHTRDTRRIFFAILVSGLFSTLGVGLFSFTIPLLSLDEKVSGIWLGSAFAGYYLAKMLIAPVAGIWGDKVGPRLPLLLTTLIGCLAPLAYFLHATLTTLYAIQFILGLVSGLIKPIGMATLGGNGPKQALPRWFALYSMAFNIALFCGPLLGGFLYLDRSIKPPLLGLSLCMGIASLIIVVFLPKDIRTIKVETTAKTQELSRLDALYLLLSIFGRTLGIGLLTAFYPILLALKLGWSGLGVAILYAVPSFTTCLGLALMGRIQNRKPQILTIVIGMLLSASALFALGTSMEPWHFVLWGAVMGLGTAISIPASMVAASEMSRNQGMAFGTTHVVAGLGFLLAPLLGGYIVQTFHSVAPALQFIAAIGFFSCIPLLSSGFRDHLYWGTALSWSAAISCGVIAIIPMYFLSVQPGTPLTASGKDIYRFTDVGLGTIINLTIKAKSQGAADKAAQKTIVVMRMLQKDYDHRNMDGSIGRINRGAGQYWVTPSDRSYALIRRALRYSEKTGGAFDPTIGALTTSPLYYALDETLARLKKGLVGHSLVLTDDENKRIHLKKQGMALDLGGIAKGTIIDAAVALLRKQGIQAGIVEAGGDFYCFGDQDWTVGIRHPRSKDVYKTLTIREKGICGSGDYQQFVTVENHGKKELRHHIIDPSDMSSANESAGVTVIADSAEKADALATALFILGPRRGKEIMSREYPTASAMWFTPDLRVIATDNFHSSH